MASNDLTAAPFTAFNYSVEISVADGAPLCAGAFSECDGLEMTQEIKTIREGGNNGVQVRMGGPTAYGNLTLKRGLTASFDLWTWFEQAVADSSVIAHTQVVVYAQDGSTELVSFVLQGCRPLKLKAPPLNAKDGMVAIEELQIAYQSLTLQPPS
ncbi:MAG TPA: phage tail protein [Solirubrobacteraceae bacterium]|nr:phage tail protein [Solirubrobacteraceae bacterium]